jgi:hypothetical protein
MQRFLKTKDSVATAPNSRSAGLSPFADKKISPADPETLHLAIFNIHKEYV